ncbi:MAG: hypothetical protein ALAOOOJD_00458 [bacterium]|nr:hypothetical protein [bacterium]
MVAATSMLSSCLESPVAPPDFPDNSFPVAPQNLNASITVAEVVLSWTFDDSLPIKEFNIYRQTAPDGGEQRIGKSSQTKYHDQQRLSTGFTYIYSVTAVSKDGYEGRRSETLSILFTPDYAPSPVMLAQPAPLDTVAGLRLSWSRYNEDNFASYRIFRSTSSPVNIEVLPQAIINEAATTRYDDGGLTRGATYYYRVAVYNRTGLSSASNEVSGTVPAN